MQTVIFDLDGTLADTSGDLIAAANACFSHMGAKTRLDPVADAATAFHGGRAMLTLGLTREGRFSAELLEQYYPHLLRAYDRAIDVHTTIYPGAMAAVARLRDERVKVGICTNKPAALAEKLLTRLGIRGEFAAMIGADTLPVRKPDPAPYRAAVQGVGGVLEQSCLIGDTDTDRKTAAAAGVPCVLVTFGPTGMDVADLKPEALLHDYADLPEIVQELLQ